MTSTQHKPKHRKEDNVTRCVHCGNVAVKLERIDQPVCGPCLAFGPPRTPIAVHATRPNWR